MTETDGFQPGYLEENFSQRPFADELGVVRGTNSFVTFGGSVQGLLDGPGVAEDLADLANMPAVLCAYGATEFYLEAFAVPLSAAPRTARDVLSALRVRDLGTFAGEVDAECAELRWPGRRPEPSTPFDTIHTDPARQFLFPRPNAESPGDQFYRQNWERSRSVHAALGDLVRGPIFYVVVHEAGGLASDLVVLFAVGQSRRGSRLLGYVSQQVCHNLCD